MRSATGWWGNELPVSAATQTLQIDDPLATRQAGRDLLSLLLMDARNHLLQRIAQDETLPALRLAAAAGHYQEQWISCHVQRGRGEGCDAASVRLAGVEPALEAWLLAEAETPGQGPTPERLRGYLAQTLDITLDLLSTTPETDDALHFYRQALLHEDRLCFAEPRFAEPSCQRCAGIHSASRATRAGGMPVRSRSSSASHSRSSCSSAWR